MISKVRVWALFLVLLGGVGLAARLAFGACSAGCLDFYGFQENGKRWTWYSSAPLTGYARIGYGESPLGGTDTELTCVAKPAAGTCNAICASCPAANEPCQRDNCTVGNGNSVTYTCYLACTD